MTGEKQGTTLPVKRKLNDLELKAYKGCTSNFNLLQFTSETGSWDIFCFVIS